MILHHCCMTRMCRRRFCNRSTIHCMSSACSWCQRQTRAKAVPKGLQQLSLTFHKLTLEVRLDGVSTRNRYPTVSCASPQLCTHTYTKLSDHCKPTSHSHRNLTFVQHEQTLANSNKLVRLKCCMI